MLPPITSGPPLLNRVHHCDYMLLLRALPDASIDAIITDPPYGITELAFDKGIAWADFWQQARRVLKLKKSPAILFSQQPFTTDLINSNRRGWRHEIVYEKGAATGYLNAKRMPLKAHENIEIFADAEADYFPQMKLAAEYRNPKKAHRPGGEAKQYKNHLKLSWEENGWRYPRSVWKFSQRQGAFEYTISNHPTEKPVELLRELILTYTRPGAIILDPFCGSGSTALAARLEQRAFICGDYDVVHVNTARRRLSEPYTLPLFAAVEGS